jgi:hypothetical protein
VTLHSFAELGEYFDAATDVADVSDNPDAPDGREVDDPATPEPDRDDAPVSALPDLAALLEQLASAGSVLACLRQTDQAARAAAADLLTRYEALMDAQGQAEAALAQARQVRAQAEALATGAFRDDSRAEAAEVLAVAAEAASAAERLLVAHRAEADALASDPTLARLLDVRRQERERQDAAAAAAECARRLREGLAAVERALAAGRLEEAGAMLGPLAKEHPDSAEVASLESIIARRAQAVKSSLAEEALRLARRVYRQAPAEAVAHLETLDLAGLPERLRHQVTGLWTAACARLCRERGAEDPRLRYLPQPGVGVVLAREAAGQPYVVVSALGARFAVGEPVDERFVQRARPLRASGR